MSLPNKHRLKRDRDIQSVFDEGDFYEGQFYHLIVKPIDHNTIRATVICSAQTASRATERNRIKRLGRESLRLVLEQLKPGHDLIILATRRAHGDLKRQDVDEDLHARLEEAELFLDPADERSGTNEADLSLPGQILDRLVQCYQDWVSPFLGRHCRFYPSCSEYTRIALRKHGLVRGSYLAVTRVARCNPLGEGGVDPVPEP